MTTSKSSGSSASPSEAAERDDRRGFLTKLLAAVFGAVLITVPLVTGLMTFFSPLRRRGSGGSKDFIRVAFLDEIPLDGTPRRFQVIADMWDKWTFSPQQPIGSVFLARAEPSTDNLRCFNTICPHAGCSVRLADNGDQKEFKCPCHNSAFHLDGSVIQPTPSPRCLDTLEVELRPGANGRQEVWVRYENFYTGKAEKVAKA